MMLYYKVTGLFDNGHKYEAMVSEADYSDFLQKYLNSRDDGSFLDPESVVIEQVEYQIED